MKGIKKTRKSKASMEDKSIAYRVLLTKVESTNKNLRTNTVEGQTIELPQEGKGFFLIGEALTSGATARFIQTSEIVSVKKIGDSVYIFKTLNSTYNLEVLGTVTVD